MTSFAETASFTSQQHSEYADHLAQRALNRFKAISKAHVFFHCIFYALAAAELITFALLLSFWSKSFMLAFPLAAFVLTIFIYIVLISTFQTRKTEQFWRLKSSYLKSCGHNMQSIGNDEHHLTMACCASRLANMLHDQEYRFYPLGKYPTIASISAFLHWRDVFLMKEILCMSAIDHYVQIVQLKATDVEVHTHLANGFVALSKLYLQADQKEIHFLGKGDCMRDLQNKLQAASQSALEEFKILDSYAPNDPWIHAQLARCYRQLNMTQREIEAYEKIVQLSPHDYESTFRLGFLYFQEGQSAKALEIYQQLKQAQYPQAEELLRHYNTLLRKLLANSLDMRL